MTDAKAKDNLASAVAGKRMTIELYDWGFVPALNTSYTQYARQAMAAWDHYLNTGFIDKSAKAQFSVEESNSYNKVWANVDTFMSTNIPKFIKGILDVNNEADWGDYVKMLNKYSPDKIVKSYQRVFDVYK